MGWWTRWKFLISDVTGLKQETEGERMTGPELSSYKDSVWWNCEIDEADYQKIAEAVNGYLSLFQSEELVQGRRKESPRGRMNRRERCRVISLLKSSEQYLI